MGEVTILTDDPWVVPLAHMAFIPEGLTRMLEWVKDRRPDCVPFDTTSPFEMFPHRGQRDMTGRSVIPDRLTDNEMLVELCGRKCYNSFGAKAGQKTNKGYIENTQVKYDIPHASIMYHAKMSFFIAGVSRRVSHELIRHYVGADRDEEGSPSQESTRYTEHTGHFVATMRILDQPDELQLFHERCQRNYDDYLAFIERQMARGAPEGTSRTMARKRVLEAASNDLKHSIETSFVWTTNPIALAKMFRERHNDAADLEYFRFARVWKKLCVSMWPNLFPQPWMKE